MAVTKLEDAGDGGRRDPVRERGAAGSSGGEHVGIRQGRSAAGSGGEGSPRGLGGCNILIFGA